MKYIDKEYVEKIVKDYNKGHIISRRKNIFYKGIEYTLNSNVYYVLNNEEKKEWAKCYNDKIYFIEKYLNIKLRKYQIEWIKLYDKNRFIIYNVARLTGVISIMSAIYLHQMIFENKSIYYINNKVMNHKEFVDKIKIYYLRLPYYLKPSIVVLNSKKIVFNNSAIFNTTKDNIDVNYDEYNISDFAHNDKLYQYYKDIMPIVSTKQNSRLIITSTPNGKNYFYDLYKNSILPDGHPDKNGFKSIQTFWSEVEGRDENWKQEEIKRLGSEDIFNQEHNLEF